MSTDAKQRGDEDDTPVTVDDLVALKPSINTIQAYLREVTGSATFSIAPPVADPREAWKTRADEYEAAYGQYKGPEHWRRFTAILAATGSVSKAALLVGVTVGAVKRRRERYACFAERCTHATEYFHSAVLEHAAVTRAVDGVLRPVWHKGLMVGHEVVYSDNLLVKLLEGNMPEKYKPRALVDIDNNTLVIEGGLPDMPVEPNPHRVIEHAPQPAAAPPQAE